MRSLVKAKRWLLLTRWVHLNSDKRQQLNHLDGQLFSYFVGKFRRGAKDHGFPTA
jgi:hypothetical protein